MPDLTGLEWAWLLWRDAGMCSPEGGALSWSEIAAFAEAETLEPWQRRLIRDMSKAYCDGLGMVSPAAISPLDLEVRQDVN